MCGVLFHIDEDAYDLLSEYESSLRTHLSKQEGGSEIFDDIEARIVELLTDSCKDGIVDLATVQSVIRQIGSPEQITDGSYNDLGTAERDTKEAVQQRHKVLTRVRQGKLICGVLSGLSAYLNIDVRLIRIIFVIVCLFSGFFHSRIFTYYIKTGPNEVFSVDYGVMIYSCIFYFFCALLLPIRERPEDESEESTATFSAPQSRSPKKLFRNTDDAWLAGLMSGLAKYTNTDAALWRLAFILLLPLLPLTLCYIIAALVIPAAKTPEEKLLMSGTPINAHTIAKIVTQESERDKSGSRKMPGCINFLGSVLRGNAYLLGLMLIVPCIAIVFFTVVYIVDGSSIGFTNNKFVDAHLADGQWVLYFLLISLFVACAIPLFVTVHAIMTKFEKAQPLSTWNKIAVLVAECIAIGCAVAAGAKLTDKIKHIKLEEHAQQMHDIDGSEDKIYVNTTEWKFYSQNRLKLLNVENCRKFTSRGEHYSGDRNIRYVNVEGTNIIFRTERTDTLPNGTYTVSAVVRAQGEGALFYAIGADTATVTIPAYGKTVGELISKAREKMSRGEELTPIERQTIDASDKKKNNGYGWSIVSCTVDVSDGLLRYGVCSDSKSLGTHADIYNGNVSLISATDFKVTKQEVAR